MNDVTITIDEQILITVCDAALKAGGINLISACNQVIGAIQKSRMDRANGKSIEVDERLRAN